MPGTKNNSITKVALLRGINVGGNTLIKMEDLRSEFESLGYANIKTILASGNVIFDSKKKEETLSKEISKKLAARLGREIIVIVIPIEEIQKLEASEPFKKIEVTKDTRLYITYIAKEAQQLKFYPTKTSGNFTCTRLSDGVLITILPDIKVVGTLDVMEELDKAYQKKVTTRNWNTILKILKAAN